MRDATVTEIRAGVLLVQPSAELAAPVARKVEIAGRDHFTASEYEALALPEFSFTERHIRDLAEEGNWPKRRRQARGGGWEYPVSVLPEVARNELKRRQRMQDAEAGKAFIRRDRLKDVLAERSALAGRQAGLVGFVHLDDHRQREAEARAIIVKACDAYIADEGLPKKRGRELFATAYAKGEIPAEQWVRELIPTFCANSIENWRKHLETEGLSRLAGNYGKHRKGSGKIDSDPEINAFVLGMLHDHPHAGADKVIAGLRARFKDRELPSYRTVQRWLKQWKEDNKQLFVAVTNPDAWRSGFKAAGGNASERIVRLNQRWEFDSTKADILLADGYRHVIVGVIDVYSRRMKLLVSRTSAAAAVASLTRRALLDWGVPEEAGTDNGSDYVSQHMKRVFLGLDIHQDIAPPFTPEHKPFIERHFGTFNHDLMELLDGFIGHNVAERKDIEARRSFAQRLMKTGETVEIRMTAEELQDFCDQWTDNIHAHNPHSGLNGRTPFEVAAAYTGQVARISDERALDVLLAEAPGNGGIRTVTKKGIRLDHGMFEHPALGGLEGQPVRILLDDADIGEIFVFDEDGAFLCKAICPERTGISRKELAVKRQEHQKKTLAAQKAALKKAAKEANTKGIAHEILLDRATAAGKLAHLPKRGPEHTTEALREAGRAARAHEAPKAAPVSEAEATRLKALEAELAPELPKPALRPAQIIKLDTPEIRFSRAIDIEKRAEAGKPVSDEETRWLAMYRAQPEYRARRKLYEDFGDAVLTA